MSKKVVSHNGTEKVWRMGDRHYRKHCLPDYINIHDGIQYIFNYYDRTIIVNLIDYFNQGANIRKGVVHSSLDIFGDGTILK